MTHQKKSGFYPVEEIASEGCEQVYDNYLMWRKDWRGRTRDGQSGVVAWV